MASIRKAKKAFKRRKRLFTIEAATEKKMNWFDVIRFFSPTATDEMCDFLLWEQTCYPFSSEMTFKQIKQFFN